MTQRAEGGGHRLSRAEERHIREAALDQTIDASFPASDPPSTNPNPLAPDAVDLLVAHGRMKAEALHDRWQNGEIVEENLFYDQVGFLRRIGVL